MLAGHSAPTYGAAGACQPPARPGPLLVGHWLRLGAAGAKATGCAPARGGAAGAGERLCEVGSAPWVAGRKSSRPTKRELLVGAAGARAAGSASGSRCTPGPLAPAVSGCGTTPSPGPAGAGTAAAPAAPADAERSNAAVASAAGRCGYTASTGCWAASWYTSGRVGGRAEPPSTSTAGSASSQARSRTENSGGFMGSSGGTNDGPGSAPFAENFPNATACGPHLAENSFPAVV